MTEFCKSNFIKFIEEFVPIDNKFGKWDDNVKKYIWPNKERNLKSEVMYCAQEEQPFHIESRDAASMIINTELVYGNLDKARLYQTIFQITMEKFLIEYVSMPGLSTLYSEHYPEFEWSMHVNLNFKDQRNSYYRDHFIHQIRNMYMMYTLLNDPYIYKKAVENLTNPSVCRLSEFIWQGMGRFRQQFDKLPKSFQNAIYKNCNSEKYCEFESPSDCYYIRYVLYASSTIASLFHDIGYPIAYCYETEDRAMEFIPAFSSLIGGEDVSFNHIQNLLGDTLLFQIVNPKDIKSGFEKRDHGVLSALLLALNYYRNGKINELSIEQRVALEVAILVIYNHTLNFLYCDDGSKSNLYKLQFARDPLSWLFRLCDDAQEWDREYFEIGNTPNLLFCSKCHTPLIKKVNKSYDFEKSKDYINKYLNGQERCEFDYDWDSFVKITNYRCRCSKSKEDMRFNRFAWFERRQIITVNVCDYVRFEECFQKVGGYKKNTGYLLLNFHYDPYKQLRLCMIHHKFSKYRANDLKKLKRFVKMQSFINNSGEGYKGIFIKHNLTPNPYLLKAMIWEEYFESKGEVLGDLNSEIASTIKKIYRCKGSNDLINNIIFNAIFYVSLFYCWKENKKETDYDPIEYAKQKAESWRESEKLTFTLYKMPELEEVLEKLTNKQIKNKIDFDDNGNIVSVFHNNETNDEPFDLYERYLIEENGMYTLIQQYCDLDSSINNPQYYARDYYSDLFLYEYLSLKTKQLKKKNKK